jgi:hypothetical protein
MVDKKIRTIWNSKDSDSEMDTERIRKVTR